MPTFSFTFSPSPRISQRITTVMETPTVKLEDEEAQGSLSLMAISDISEEVERGNGPEIEVKIEVGQEGFPIAQSSEGGIKGGMV